MLLLHGAAPVFVLPVRFSTRSENRKDAVRMVQARKKVDLAAALVAVGPLADVTFDVAAEMYWDNKGVLLKGEANGSNSSANGRSVYKRAVLAVGPGTFCRQIDKAFMMKLRARLSQEKPLSGMGVPREGPGTLQPKQVNKILSSIMSILRVAETMLKTTFPDMPDTKVDDVYLKTQNRGRYLKDTEEALLMPCCDEDLRDALAFDLETGLRAEELATLEWDEIDWSEQSIMPSVKGIGTDVRRHTIYLSETALSILERRLASGIDDVHVFTFRSLRTYWADGRLVEKGSRLPASYVTLRARFVAACRKARIHGLILHDIRRAAARRLFWDAGLEIAQAFLGHSSSKTTLAYLCLSEADTKAAIRHREARMKVRRAEIAAAIASGGPVPELDERRVAALRNEFARLGRLAAVDQEPRVVH